MSKKVLSLIVAVGIIGTSLLTPLTAYADTPEENWGNEKYGTLEEQMEMPGVTVYKDGTSVEYNLVNPKYVVASFKCINGTVKIDSSVYIGYNYVTSGLATKVLQEALKALGYDAGTSDGIFGPKTHQALINFQRDNGLSVDATAGPQTWTILGSKCSGKSLSIVL